MSCGWSGLIAAEAMTTPFPPKPTPFPPATESGRGASSWSTRIPSASSARVTGVTIESEPITRAPVFAVPASPAEPALALGPLSPVTLDFPPATMRASPLIPHPPIPIR